MISARIKEWKKKKKNNDFTDFSGVPESAVTVCSETVSLL